MIEAVALLWTVAILIWTRNSSVVALLTEGVVVWEVFIMLGSHPTDFLLRWPLLQPGSWLMIALACTSIVGSIARRLLRSRRRFRSPQT